MNTFLYATTTPMMWTFRIAVLVRVIVSYAAVMAQFTVSALSRTPTADRSKSISDGMVFYRHLCVGGGGLGARAKVRADP